MALPDGVRYVVIGAGIHGLSTAYHLALALKRHGQGRGSDILVVDKTGIAAGASGIACGVIRNNYYQPAMRELMAHSVEVWERDPSAYSYHAVGYMHLGPEGMRSQLGDVFAQQQAINYDSVFIEGPEDCDGYMHMMFSDWQAKGITAILHEKSGGYANNAKAIYGLAAKAESEGVRIISGLNVTGFERANGSPAVSAVVTERGTIKCDEVVVAVGPWVNQIWSMLDLPKTIGIKSFDGGVQNEVPMWVYWSLQEGTLGVDPSFLKTEDGLMPPVIHVDTDAPLYSDVDGSVITDELWGIYYKPDFNFGGVQGGAVPHLVKTPADEVAVDPYGPDSPEFVVDDHFAHMWCSALAHCQKRFEGQIPRYKKEPSGGIGCFTPDSFPVFDRFCQNVTIIADSNHGYKMIGVGELVAGEIMDQPSTLLKPFRFARYAEGRLHPVSNSPYPWS